MGKVFYVVSVERGSFGPSLELEILERGEAIQKSESQREIDEIDNIEREIPIPMHSEWSGYTEREFHFHCLREINGKRFRHYIPVHGYKKGQILDSLPISRSSLPDSFEAQIKIIFPDVNGEGLENILTNLRVPFAYLRGVTNKTGSEAVFNFEFDDRTIYCKVNRNKRLLQKSADYITKRWNIPLLRPITPKLAGLIESEHGAALLTYDTSNLDQLVDIDDQMDYFLLRLDAMNHLAKETGISATELEFDPVIVDTFNAALEHVCMAEFKDDEIYVQDKKPLIYPFEYLVERSGRSSDKELHQFLRSLGPKYRKVHQIFLEANFDNNIPLTLIDLDARPENVTNSSFRARCDYDCVQPGLPIYQLAKLQSRSKEYSTDSQYVKPYVILHDFIEDRLKKHRKIGLGNVEVMQRQVGALSFLNAARDFSYKLMQGLLGDARERAKACRLNRVYLEW